MKFKIITRCDWMQKYMARLLCNILIHSITLILVFISNACWAQSEDEMQLLHLFYNDKDLVVSATRFEKNISQVAENITVITSDEIEAMNAHTVAEVLNKVPGIFISSNQDFMAASLISIQGSESEQVLVTLDEIPWNSISSSTAETSLIPIGTIDRIEIVKGPASSAWGSSLGGVINIITKKGGALDEARGTISAAYGASESRDLRAGVSGKKGAVGYYLYAGNQASNGLVATRSFDGWNVFSKINTPVSSKGGLTLELGYTSEKMGFGDYVIDDLYAGSTLHTFYSTGSADLSFSKDIDFRFSIFSCSNYATLPANTLGLSGIYGPHGTLIKDNHFKEKNTGVKARMAWKTKYHTFVLGSEYDAGNLNQTTFAGPFLQDFMGAPAVSVATPRMKQWAIYVNDSIVLDRLSVTPGIRYDYNGNSGAFTSPSLGATYRIGSETIARVSISRGFTTPPLSSISGGGLFLEPNPSLKPEIIWAYQAGMETSMTHWVWTKITLFNYKVSNLFMPVPTGSSPFDATMINDGARRRKGVEVEAETIPFHHTSFSAGYSYIAMTPPDESGSSNMHSIDLKLVYDDESLQAQISGRLRFFDTDTSMGGNYSDFIWDFNINKALTVYHNLKPQLFFTAHNLFNGSQYLLFENRNQGRWLEGGVRLHF
jgi:vitamin B12 transporter